MPAPPWWWSAASIFAIGGRHRDRRRLGFLAHFGLIEAVPAARAAEPATL
jgi:hypothetical protein